jgi:hypothetical protein
MGFSRGPRLASLILFFTALLGSAVAAEAKVMTFDDVYTADVPAGWTVDQPEKAFVVLTSPDGKAVFLITHGLSMTVHRDKVAELVKRHDALRIGSPDRMVSLMRIQDRRVAVTVIGDHRDRVPLYRSINPTPGDKMRDVWRSN